MAILIFKDSAITIKNNTLMAVLVFNNSAITIKNNVLMAGFFQNHLRFGAVKI
jgi:hypothetical protein